MEEDKSLEKNNHHGHHHEGKRCGLFNCCSGSKSKMIHIFLALAVALVIFLIGLSAGSHLNRYRGN
ncbi:MAG: hypothetical protein NTX66_01060, partial [Candidatus Falkowbacteria bacterium]|nr:hypothetical protein [Candidatus Falkowbacteria bacterium]